MQFSVLGCGWLGRALCWSLIDKGHPVKASTTSPEKLAPLAAHGIAAHLVDLDSASAEAIGPFLEGSEVLIINIPPRIKTAVISYPDKMQVLLPYIKNAGIKKVVFVSSTSVYADDAAMPVITEAIQPDPHTESGRQIWEAEEVLQNCPAFATTIIRPAGLIGEGRQPVYHLAGKTGLENPDAPVNLISRVDLVQLILGVIERGAWGTTFNAAHPSHPTRKEYYTAKAIELGLPAPQFSHGVPSVGKIISSQKAQKTLGASFLEEL